MTNETKLISVMFRSFTFLVNQSGSWTHMW